jgi:hypothetical protein
MLSAIRDRFSPSSGSGSAHDASARDGDAHQFAGYDRLDTRQAIDGLSDHSQIELTAVESYQRTHENRQPAMTDSAAAAHLPNAMPAEVTRALVSLWTQYAGKRPTNARTDVRGNVVTCELADAVEDFNQRMIAPQTGDTVRGVGKLTPAAYRREAVAAVVRLTRQRVASFVSSHDRGTDVATEVFTLEPSLSRGAPRAERRFRHASWPPPPGPRAGT